jgi:hypothetical protein
LLLSCAAQHEWLLSASGVLDNACQCRRQQQQQQHVQLQVQQKQLLTWTPMMRHGWLQHAVVCMTAMQQQQQACSRLKQMGSSAAVLLGQDMVSQRLQQQLSGIKGSLAAGQAEAASWEKCNCTNAVMAA